MGEIAPLGVIHDLEVIDVPKIETLALGPHNISVVRVNKPGPVKLDILFPAGRFFERQKSEAYAANMLLKEGSRQYTSEQVSALMEFYGASFSPTFSFDLAGLSLTTLDIHWATLWPIMKDSLLNPLFLPTELDLFVKMNIEELKMEESQTEFLAYRQLTQLLFGSEHPYGYNSSAATYMALSQDLLADFHQEHYKRVPYQAVVCAYDPDLVLRNLEELWTSQPIPLPLHLDSTYDNEITIGQEYTLSLKGKKQTSIRWGKRIPGKESEDFCEIFILSTIFGGYFGSRLVERIREREGLSYQVFSSVETMKNGAYWMLGAEVAKSNVSKTTRILKEELVKLQNEMISPQELITVKNYLMGQLMNNLDGAINISDLLRSLLCEGQDFCYIKKLINVIRGITASDLQRVAGKYALWQNFTQVRVG